MTNNPIEIVYTSNDTVLSPDMPVRVENTRLILDRAQDKAFICCVFSSQSAREINAILIEATCYDASGAQIGGPLPFQYLHLRVCENMQFGGDMALPLPYTTAQRVDVRVQKIMFADGERIAAALPATVLPAAVSLEQHFGSAELAAQYARETTPYATYVVSEQDGYWRCTCGTIHHAEETACAACGCEKAALLAALDTWTLQDHLQQFTAQQEQALAEEQERALAAAAKKAKRKKKLAIWLPIAGVLLATLIVLTLLLFVPLARYIGANADLEDGNYDEAHETYLELNGFWDSEEKAQEAMYQKGKSLLESGEYDQAISAFSMYPYYADAEDMIDETNYQKAGYLLQQGDFVAAEELYQSLGAYKDSSTMLQEVNYQKAHYWMNEDSYLLALSIFEKLGDYKDSKTQCKEAKYQYVRKHRNNNDTDTYEFLKELRWVNYKDADDIYDDLYTWRLTGGFNTTRGDESAAKTSVSRSASYLHFWLQLEGGTPGETIDLTHTTIYPDGEARESSWYWYDKDDSETFGGQWSGGLYNNPQDGETGTLTVKVYELHTNKLIGTISTRITY